MPNNRDFRRIKEELNDEIKLQSEGFRILGEVADFTNNLELEKQGRELVIRALAVRNYFPNDLMPALYSLVRATGLYPYMTDANGRLSVYDEFALEFHRAPINNEEIYFHALQAKVFNALMSKMNVVLSASTSVGKSLIIDALLEVGSYENVVIVLPTIALIDETRRRLTRRFGDRYKMITHQSQNPYQSGEGKNVFILTQERVLSRDDIDHVDLFILDEFYKLDFSEEETSNRAIDLNLAFHKLVGRSKQFYLLGPNIKGVEGLERYQHIFYPSDFTTVAVDVFHYGLPRDGEERLLKAKQLCESLNDPTIVYCQAPRTAEVLASFLIERSDINAAQRVRNAVEWLAENYHPSWLVPNALSRGIGVHHGAIPRSIQQYMVRAFNQKKVKVLICTSTIIEGVNTIAKNVVVYDRRKNGSVMTNFTYRNIQGRAGRMGEYFVGTVHCLEAPPAQDTYTVRVPLGTQDVDTPIGLLANLPDDVLTEWSRERIKVVSLNGLLPIDIIAKNKHIASDIQIDIASQISHNKLYYSTALEWPEYPSFWQLEALCNIIFVHLEQRALHNICITSGSSLAWNINAFAREKSIRSYIDACIKSDVFRRTPSEIVRHCLTFIRNFICHKFPQHAVAIGRIKDYVIHSYQTSEGGSLQNFAGRAESMFMDPILVSLEEYGLPIQIAQKLEHYLMPESGLDAVLERLRGFVPVSGEYSDFEIEIINDVKNGL
ncbi:DEAD/DEAH box helicase [Azospirillum brasilense]|uniref:DEAD/DEAH box helicase n=1 Tax=Azospirillum brasilense TaxID=192 RepID=UPI000E0A9952|nr:DEAD/DEAH box helicase [Azospirillum brasilense]